MPDSKTPKKNRVAINPPQFVTKPWQIITTPNINMQKDTAPQEVSHSLSSHCRLSHTPNVRLQFLQEDIRRNFAKDVRHEEDRQGGVVFGTCDDVQVGLESKNSRVTDIDTLSRGTKVSSLSHSIIGARDSYRSKKASRYKIQMHGRRRPSILAINLRSLMLENRGASESDPSK